MSRVPQVIKDFVSEKVEGLGFQAVKAEKVLDSGPGQDEILCELEREKVVNEILLTLSPREEQVVRMCVMDGHSQERAAQALGTTRNRVRSMMLKAMIKLRNPARAEKLKGCCSKY